MLIRDSLIQSQRKPIRSFVERQGRKTWAMEQNVKELWPVFGLALQRPLCVREVFGRTAPLTLEIGFGNGQALLELASQHPDQDFIGIEVYKTGVAQLLTGMKLRGLRNIRVYCADAIEVLTNCVPDDTLQTVQLFFPDPWPKLRHHKRRLVQTNFITLVASKLKVDGIFHMATDWQDYAEHMMRVMTAASNWQNLAGPHNYSTRPASRVLTKFEQRGQRLGHGTWDIIFRKPLISNIL